MAQAQRSRPGWVEVLIRDNGVGMSNFREGSCALASFAHGFNKSGARSTFGAMGGSDGDNLVPAAPGIASDTLIHFYGLKSQAIGHCTLHWPR